MNPNDIVFNQILTLLDDLNRAEQHGHPAHISAALAGIKALYEPSNIVIYRHNGYVFYMTLDEQFTPCADCERLLVTGQWQSCAERAQENQLAFERVAR